MNKDSNYFESLFELLKRTQLGGNAERAKMVFVADIASAGIGALVAEYVNNGNYVFYAGFFALACNPNDLTDTTPYDLACIMYVTGN